MKTRNLLLRFLKCLCFLLFTAFTIHAQVLWSPTFYGGPTNGGTLVQMNPDGNGFTTFHDFSENTGSSPMGSVMQASSGKIYGTCLNGGCDSSCVIYCFNPDSGTYTNCWCFDITHGDFPMSGLTEASNGLLYGAGSAGGAADDGVIYSLDPTTNVYTDLYDLPGGSDFAPCGALLLASDGKLYGMTSGFSFYSQSAHGFGSIYSYDISNNTYTNLYNFTGAKDGFGFGALIEHNGLLYGMTSGWPSYAQSTILGIFPRFWPLYPDPLAPVNNGNIFSFDPASKTYTDLYDFNDTAGRAPYGTLLWATDGKLYGMACSGGVNNLGVIFRLDPSNNTYTKLYDFDGAHGATPMGDLTQSTDGNLYGTTSAGGSSAAGVAFRFNPTSGTYTVLNNFDGLHGASPLGGTFSMVHPGSSMGILNPVGSRSLSVYPVPAHNNITVNIESLQGENPVFSLTDIHGRTVWGPKAEPVNGNSIQLDLSSLESGVYFLRAANGDNVVTKKILRE